MTRKQHYLRLWRKADAILQQPGNPCDIQVIDGDVTCHMSRKHDWVKHNVLCCSGCVHHGKDGCQVKSLWCKLGWCFGERAQIEGMKVEDHPVFIAIRDLRAEAVALGLPMYARASMERNFEIQASYHLSEGE